ncbi:adenylyltransferase/cytidyltransferase family protein [Candidatus Peribacteria bacterium]|nr:adenylyltransferase/cytidyltransferase family protein [Candidatus Peribacteria bacterium]
MGSTTGVFIGRFQPFHEGHRRCIEHILSERDRCIILVRATEPSEKNPIAAAERIAMIRAHFPDSTRVEILTMNDPGADLSVYIGRDVGYDLIALDARTEAISATDLRRQLYERAGKSYDPATPRHVR